MRGTVREEGREGKRERDDGEDDCNKQGTIISLYHTIVVNKYCKPESLSYIYIFILLPWPGAVCGNDTDGDGREQHGCEDQLICRRGKEERRGRKDNGNEISE